LWAAATPMPIPIFAPNEIGSSNFVLCIEIYKLIFNVNYADAGSLLVGVIEPNIE
ncbi:12095_t:CDS:2, partial [Gigaspora margarita]